MNFVQKWCQKNGFHMYAVEKLFLNDLISDTPSFKKALKHDISGDVYNEIDERLLGRVPSHYKALFYGPSGKAKSVHPDTLIFTDKGFVKIIDMFNNEENYKVISIDCDNFKTRLSKCFGISRHECKEDLIEVKTKSGRSVIATLEHSFLIFDGNKIISLTGDKLKIGDFLPVSMNLDLPASEEVFEGYELDWYFGFFIGAFLSEGCLQKQGKRKSNGICIANVDAKFKNELKVFSDRLGMTFNKCKNESDNRLYSKRLYDFLFKNCYSKFYQDYHNVAKEGKGNGSSAKVIPSFTYFAPLEFRKGLLSGLFSGDGCLQIEGEIMLTLTTKSNELSLGINILLNSLGIMSYTRSVKAYNKYKGNTYSLIKIDRTDIKKFIDLIGFRQTRKNELSKKIKDNSEYDRVPSCKMLYLNDYRRQLGHNRGYMTFIGAKKQIEFLNEKIKKVKKILEGDIFFDKIISIKKIPYDGYVYDLTIPQVENFMLSNGLFVHNSYAGLYLCYYEMNKMGNKFDVKECVAFDNSILQLKLEAIIKKYVGVSMEDFLTSGKVLRIKVSMLKDEDVPPAGQGKMIEKQKQQNIEKTLRQAQVCFTYCSPIIEQHIFDGMFRFFAINFETEQSVAFVINPDTLRPIGIVRFNLPPKDIIADYELMKTEFLLNAGQSQFGGGYSILKEQIANDIIHKNYDVERIGNMEDADNKRQQMMIIEKVCAGRVGIEGQKDIYEEIIKIKPELDIRKSGRKKEEGER